MVKPPTEALISSRYADRRWRNMVEVHTMGNPNWSPASGQVGRADLRPVDLYCTPLSSARRAAATFRVRVALLRYDTILRSRMWRATVPEAPLPGRCLGQNSSGADRHPGVGTGSGPPAGLNPSCRRFQHENPILEAGAVVRRWPEPAQPRCREGRPGNLD
jgi:hypothetical protein